MDSVLDAARAGTGGWRTIWWRRRIRIRKDANKIQDLRQEIRGQTLKDSKGAAPTTG